MPTAKKRKKIDPERFKDLQKKKKLPKTPLPKDLFPKEKLPKNLFPGKPKPPKRKLPEFPKITPEILKRLRRKKKDGVISFDELKKMQNQKPKTMEAKDGGKVSKFGMLSVKAGVDNNPNPTQADRIVGAKKKMNKGGPVDSPKKGKKKKMPGMLAIGIEIIKPKKPIKAARGGLAGRLAKRGYGKARS